MGNKAVGLITIFGLGFLLGISIPQVEAKRETDSQKWERLEKHRAIRRATERRYEACVAERLRECSRIES